ncbi:MAG: hypothetical protein V2A79_01810 [Planctomycetota bacterium]
MNQRTRMFKTLALLAVSMTATTVLLGHLEPSASSAGFYPSPEHIKQMVRSAVDGTERIVPDTWSGVEIVLEQEVGAYGRDRLAALSDSGSYHFWVGHHGEVWVARAWSEPRPGSAGGTIRVALASSGDGSATSPRQWAALRALLHELGGVVRPGMMSETTPDWLTLSDEATHDETLQARLRSEGLLG